MTSLLIVSRKLICIIIWKLLKIRRVRKLYMVLQRSAIPPIKDFFGVPSYCEKAWYAQAKHFLYSSILFEYLSTRQI